MSATCFIGLDIGGTGIKYAAVKEDYTLLYGGKTDTPKGTLTLDFLSGIVSALLDKTRGNIAAKGIGISSAGIIGADGAVLRSNNIRFENPRFAEGLKARFGMPTAVLNDADCAALAEHRIGAGQGAQNMAMFTVGTGVGCGLILNGILYKGGNGCAAGGHIVTHGGGAECSCGGLGCLENYASVSALIKYAQTARKTEPDSRLWSYNILDGKNIFEAEKAGDRAAVCAVRTLVQELGYGIISILNLLRPEVIVIGGGISAEGGYLTGKLTQFVKNKAFSPDSAAPYAITTAKLGNSAGILGAAINLKEAMEKGEAL